MSEPQRIQRKRTKGWRMPDGAAYVGRPTKWGNPFVVGDRVTMKPWCWSVEIVSDREHAVGLFREYAEVTVWIQALIGDLRGKDLACWCAVGSPCHADVLLELANREVAS